MNIFENKKVGMRFYNIIMKLGKPEKDAFVAAVKKFADEKVTSDEAHLSYKVTLKDLNSIFYGSVKGRAVGGGEAEERGTGYGVPEAGGGVQVLERESCAPAKS